MYQIISDQNKIKMDEVKKLFIEYQKELGYDLCFQDFEQELETLPGKYKQPDGHLLLIKDSPSDSIAGCIALKKHNGSTCEMKRLYILPDFREKGYGKILIQEIIRLAKMKGYQTMILDTLKELKPALHLYRKFGFQETGPYYYNPINDVVYMKKEL
jgi:putative acetyltransferase